MTGFVEQQSGQQMVGFGFGVITMRPLIEYSGPYPAGLYARKPLGGLEKIPQPGNFNDMFSRQNSGD
jgi:hypothetical protein